MALCARCRKEMEKGPCWFNGVGYCDRCFRYKELEEEEEVDRLIEEGIGNDNDDFDY